MCVLMKMDIRISGLICLQHNTLTPLTALQWVLVSERGSGATGKRSTHGHVELRELVSGSHVAIYVAMGWGLVPHSRPITHVLEASGRQYRLSWCGVQGSNHDHVAWCDLRKENGQNQRS